VISAAPSTSAGGVPAGCAPVRAGASGRSSSAAAPGASAEGESVIHERGGLPVGGTHTHALVALQGLALGLQGGRYYHLGAVELGKVLVAAGRHRGAQAAEQVERAVVLAG